MVTGWARPAYNRLDDGWAIRAMGLNLDLVLKLDILMVAWAYIWKRPDDPKKFRMTAHLYLLSFND